MRSGAADREANARAGHVERLGERVELDRHVLRARNLKRARRDGAVEGELAVGQVGDQEHPVLPAERDRLLEQTRAAPTAPVGLCG